MCRRPAISSGLSCANPSWVRFPSSNKLPGAPGPHFGKSPGPHKAATSLQTTLTWKQLYAKQSMRLVLYWKAILGHFSLSSDTP